MDAAVTSFNVGGRLEANLPFNHCKTCRHGLMVYNANDMYVGRSLDLYGEFSEAEVEIFRQLIRPGDVVLDVGANIGAHTLFFAAQVGASGRVLAFEPQRLPFYALCANIALNSLTNTWCYRQAVGSRSGTMVAPELDPFQPENFGGAQLKSAGPGEEVPLITIDSLDLPVCRFLKIDVEGMEADVLQGAIKTLERTKPILYVENNPDPPLPAERLIRMIDRLGYAMYWHRSHLYHSKNFFGNPENVFGEYASFNMLCVHRDRPSRIAGLEEVAVPAGDECGASSPPAIGGAPPKEFDIMAAVDGGTLVGRHTPGRPDRVDDRRAARYHRSRKGKQARALV